MPPSLNRMYRTVGGRMLISADGRAFKKEVAAICLVNRIKPLEGDICVNIEVFRPQKRGDLDNFFKGLLDSLNGIGWKDDSQIKRIIAERFEDKTNPRVEIEITALNN